MNNQKTEQERALNLLEHTSHLMAAAKTQNEKDLAWSKKRLAMKACVDSGIPYLDMLDAYVEGYNRKLRTL